MTRQGHEIDCLARLQEMNGSLSEVFDFLLAEDLVHKDIIKGMKTSANIPKELQRLLRDLSKDGSKVQLLTYEWTILPVERIKVFVITNRNSKEFTWNY
jgi:hypothetical protein